MLESTALRDEIRRFLNLKLDDTAVAFKVGERTACNGYIRERITYIAADGNQYAKDAAEVIALADPNDHITHFRIRGRHPLTPERFNEILNCFDSSPAATHQ
jgi:hypothetical protein